MSIPHAFNRLGLSVPQDVTLYPRDFVVSTWSAPELEPLGLPNGGILDGRKKCLRNAAHKIVIMCFDYGRTLPNYGFNYNGNVPPRSTANATSPLMELRLLENEYKLVLSFRIYHSSYEWQPTNIFTGQASIVYSDDDWTTWENKNCNFDGETFTVETDKPCNSLAIKASGVTRCFCYVDRLTLLKK